ncbi:hypothetical protein [Nocardia brasiliensis]
MFGFTRGEEADIIATVGGFAGAAMGGVPGMIIVGGASAAFAEYWRDGELDSSVFWAGVTGAASTALLGGTLGGVQNTARVGLLPRIMNPKELWTSLKNLPKAFWDRQRVDDFGAKPWRWRNAKDKNYLPRPWPARFGAAGGNFLNSYAWGQFSSHDGLDFLPVMDIYPKSGHNPRGMTQMVMPNMKSTNPDYPDEFEFGTVADGFHKELPENFAGYYLSAGDPATIVPPDVLPPPPSVKIGSNLPDPPAPGSSLGGFNESVSDTYRDLVARLRNVADVLHEADVTVVGSVERTTRDLERFRGALNKSIDLVNTNAKSFPPGGITKDEHILGYTAEALDLAVSTVQDVLTRLADTANRIRTPQLPGNQPTGNQPPGNQKPPGEVPQVEPADPRDLVPGVERPPATMPDLDSVPDLGSEDRTGSGVPDVDRLINAASGNPGGVPSVSPAGLNPFGAGGIPGLNAIPGLLNQMRPTDPNSLGSPERRVPDVRGSREMAPPPAVPNLTPKPGAVTAAQTTPAPAAAATATGTGTSPAPATPSAATTTGTPPARLPDSGGGVWYDFPPVGSGIRQYVTPLVAKALDAAFGNTDGTNAQRAYQDTPAKWSNSKEMDPVGPDEAITGCVVKFERPTEGSSDSGKPQPSQPGRSGQPGKGAPEQTPLATTAVLVVFRMAENNTEGVTADSFEVIVDGQRIQYTDQLSGKAGAFGDFAGFGRPRGVTPVASAPGDAMPAQPHPSDTGSVDALIAAGTVST